MAKNFKDLTEQEILALAITLEEEDGRIYGEFAQSLKENYPATAKMLSEMQAGRDDDLTPTDNQFTADEYRIIHFIVDMPVRLPRRLLERAPPSARPLGPIIFVICEFQVIDRETESSNERGEASHAKYKERQKRAVMRRLQLGMREMKVPGRKRTKT